jgi:hypothetical protein
VVDHPGLDGQEVPGPVLQAVLEDEPAVLFLVPEEEDFVPHAEVTEGEVAPGADPVLFEDELEFHLNGFSGHNGS